jgi:hypothetical protein
MVVDHCKSVQFPGLDWAQEDCKSARGYESRKRAIESRQTIRTEQKQRHDRVMDFADYLCGNAIANDLRQEIVSTPILSSLACICRHVAMTTTRPVHYNDPVIPAGLLEQLQFLRDRLINDALPPTHSAFCLFEAWMRYALQRGIYVSRAMATTTTMATTAPQCLEHTTRMIRLAEPTTKHADDSSIEVILVTVLDNSSLDNRHHHDERKEEEST